MDHNENTARLTAENEAFRKIIGIPEDEQDPIGYANTVLENASSHVSDTLEQLERKADSIEDMLTNTKLGSSIDYMEIQSNYTVLDSILQRVRAVTVDVLSNCVYNIDHGVWHVSTDHMDELESVTRSIVLNKDNTLLSGIKHAIHNVTGPYSADKVLMKYKHLEDDLATLLAFADLIKER